MEHIIAPEKIETPEFTIRSYQPEDWPLFKEAFVSSYEHLRPIMEWAIPNMSDRAAQINCRIFRGKYLLSEDFTLGIFNPVGNKLLGNTGFHLRGRKADGGIAEIGMWVSADAAGKGLGTKALNTMLRWGFDEWPWVRLFWRCSNQNFASARIAEKVGMIKETVSEEEHVLYNSVELQDMLVYGALKGEWTYNGN
jgi:RimJ/RimL family protein N-acetyltransferase